MKFTVHTIIKNEDRFVWFAIQSVLPFAEEILVFDTGSTDKTVEIIESINSDKIIFEEKGVVDPEGLVKLRRAQLDKTKTDWFLILDGDEIWPGEELLGTIKEIENSQADLKAVISQTKNCIGDVYHYLDNSSGGYQIGGKKGHFNMRFIKKTKDLKIIGAYPLEAYIDESGSLQKQDSIIFSKHWYLHANFLKRSSSDKQKRSGSLGKTKTREKGLTLLKGELPKVLFMERPGIVSEPLKKRGQFYELSASLLTPAIILKRKWR